MSRSRKTRTYETEYSSSFKWDTDARGHYGGHENGSQLRFANSERASLALVDRRLHQFRHKLKLALLEKLDKLESELAMRGEQATPLSQRRERRPTTPCQPPQPKASSHKAVDKTKHRRAHQRRDSAHDALHDELRRSRSMAVEFKQKNESTQLWWLRDCADDDDGDASPHRDCPRAGRAAARTSDSPAAATRRPSQRPVYPDTQASTRPARGSLLSHKLSTTDNNLSQQSSFSKSSLSSYQIAQATGYQSTMDELSSFNHDNDGKSTDLNGTKKWISNSDSPQDSSRKFTELIIPKLELPIVSSDKDCSDHNAPLMFYPPYQKDDFIPDTASSESNVNNFNNFETYRLD